MRPTVRASAVAPDAPLLVQVRLPRIANASTVEAKRSRPVSDGVEPDAGATSDSTSSVVQSDGERGSKAPRVATKPRRPAYSTLKKQERDSLAKEVMVLEAQADLLRERAGLASVAAADQVKRTEHQNRLLEDTRRARLLALSGMRSLISQNLREQFGVPLSPPVRLCTDPTERRATLLALRRTKLDTAYRYVQERFRGMDLTRRHVERETWTSPEGDFCASTSDVVHFRGVQSLKQVYDAFVFYMTNMEISISEALGQLTLREDIDSVDTSVSNHRLVSSTDHGLVVEMNVASFGEYYERFDDHGDDEFALYSSECVAHDELYPYSPLERVRKDITGMVTMSPLRRTHTDDPLTVVVRRCGFLKFWRPQFHVSDAALDDLEASLAAWGDLMFQSMRATLAAAQ